MTESEHGQDDLQQDDRRFSDTSSEEPICVFGTGRSGTTIFFQVLGAHPELAWVSSLIEKYPRHPFLSVFSRLYPLALHFGLRSPVGRLIPQPSESLRSLRLSSNGLFQVPREIDETEIPTEIVRSVRDYHEKIRTRQGRRRLAIKHTGFPRFQFWRRVFPRSRFIHVLRDGRAVVYSLMRVPWWDGTLDSWWWGPMPKNYLQEYEDSGRRPAVLAAIAWKHLLDIYESESAKQAQLAVCQVKFDSFIADPVSEIRKVGTFCELKIPNSYVRSINRFNIRNVDKAWRKELSRTDLSHVEQVLADHLTRYGFS